MESMTVGQFVVAFAGIFAGLVAFVKGGEYLMGRISAAFTNYLQKALEPTNAKIDALERKIEAVDKKVDASELEDCKNYITGFVADIRRGNAITEIERERFHETYVRYDALGGNSYVHTEIEKLKKEGKL